MAKKTPSGKPGPGYVIPPSNAANWALSEGDAGMARAEALAGTRAALAGIRRPLPNPEALAAYLEARAEAGGDPNEPLEAVVMAINNGDAGSIKALWRANLLRWEINNAQQRAALRRAANHRRRALVRLCVETGAPPRWLTDAQRQKMGLLPSCR